MTTSPSHFSAPSSAVADETSASTVGRRARIASLLTAAALVVGTGSGVLGMGAASADAGTIDKSHAAVTSTGGGRTVPAHWERNIVDRMDRTLARGLGEPTMGGTWATSDDSLFGVDANGGRIGPLATGATARAYISGATTDNQVVRTTFFIPSVPTVGNGTYVALELRRQANGAAYRARVQMTTDNQALLVVTRVGGGTETVLGTPVAIPGGGGSRHAISLSATIWGDAPVHVAVTANSAGSDPVTIERDDASPARITAAGRYGIAAINTVNTPGVVVVIRGMSGERRVPQTIVRVTAPRPAPTSSAPSTPAPTSSAPSTPAPTSSSPSTPAPTSSSTSAPTGSTTSSPTGTSTSTGTTPPGAPVPSPPPANRGAAIPGSTSYPVPGNAVYVSLLGSDTNPGTVDAPYATLARAIAKAKPGVTTTIVLRGGSYHQTTMTAPNKPVVIENYPGEEVWFDGSVPVADWTQQGSTWVHSGWTAKFDSTAGYNASQAEQYQWLRSDHPMAAHPDEVFVDGIQQEQVASASEVVPGTFYSDYANNRIVLGTNPAGHAVRAVDLQKALTLLAPNSIVRGISFRRFATSVPLQGAVILDGDGQRLENAVISDIASAGLQVSGKHVTIDHATFTDNGLQGMKGNLADNLTVSNSIIVGNNSEYFNFSPVSAGIKLTRTDHATIINNLFAANHASGLWFDCSSFGMLVQGNDMLDNDHAGMVLEESASGTIVGNTSAGNADDGILIADTSNVRIWNNTLANNGGDGVSIVQDNRTMSANSFGRDTRRPFPDSSLDWRTRNIQIRDNVMIASANFHVATRNTTNQTPMQQGISFNHNLLSTNSGTSASAIGVNIGGYTTRYTASAWSSYSNDGNANVQSRGTTADGMADDMSDTTSAAPLPSDLATLLGQAGGAQIWGRC